jgi:hypothetical protein
MADGFVPPQEVRNNAKRGLELRKKHGRGGTEVGVARARDLSNGKALSLDTLNRMNSYFARHEVDKKGEGWGKDSAGYIAWLLWGGDAGRAWAKRITSEQENKEKSMSSNLTTTSYFSIEKADRNSDGTLTVYGKATDDSVDIDQQICDEAWLAKAMPDWFMTGGNIREQHSNIAAGVAKEYELKADGHYISALVVDPISVKKVENGVLRGFSIGIKSPRVVRDTKAANGRIIDGQIVEVSLVDRPANPNCQLVLAKSINGEKSLTKVEELVETTIEKEEATAEMPMNGEAKSIPSQEDMMSRYAAAKQALDEVTMMCKEYGYELPAEEKQYGESAEEESEEGPAGSGAEHELEETKELVEQDGSEMEKTTATEIIPDSTVDEPIIPGINPEEHEDSEDKSSEKSLLADINITDIVEKAVKSAMKSVDAEVAKLKSANEAVENKAASLETELATAKSLAIGGGPKRTTIATGAPTTNEWKAKADLYLAKASSTTDQILAKGYREMAKDFLAKSVSPAE